MNSQLAKREVVTNGYDEAIMLDTDGYVAEGPGENIFIVRNNLLKTTPLTSILEGITRDSIIQLAKENGVFRLRRQDSQGMSFILQMRHFLQGQQQK